MTIAPPPQFTGTIRRSTLNDEWCVYSHTIEGIVIFIGECLLREVMEYPDARQNSEWQAVTETDPEINMMVHMTSLSRMQVSNWKHNYIRKNGHPICNKNGRFVGEQKAFIRCVEDGRLYKTQKECADYYGFSQGSLSKHLRGNPQNKRVAGKTFVETFMGNETDV